MKPTKSLRATRSLIDEFCNITGADKMLATSLLEACSNNLEMAVNMHMEGIPGSLAPDATAATPATPAATQNLPGDEEEEVRAPIPQKQEVLVEGPDQIAFAFRGRRRVARSVFDKFRDFEAETKRQEEELMRGGEVVEGAASSAPSTSTSGPPTTTSGRNRRKMKTLEDLFRPPIDLIYRGTFQAVRDAGVARKRWLMVNIQDSSEFPCQVLNRDVWSNSAVKTIVKEHFIFWQVYHDSEEGQRYMMFYQVSEWPHVAILDPRTGERLVTWHKLDALTFCDLVTEFLTAHPALDGKASPPKKKLRLALVKYVGSKGYESGQYELVTNFPRREISQMDLDITLKDAGLFPQEAVFIQAR